jgi:hypothetical protein
MTLRSTVVLAIAVVLSVPCAALAGDGGTAGSPAAGGGSSTNDPNCNVLSQTMAGETCQECMTSPGVKCGDQLGKDFNYACTQSSTVQIWCNGPARTQYLSQGCSVGAPSDAAAPIAAFALVAAIGAALERRARRTPRSHR